MCVLTITSHTLVAPHVEYKLEDAPKHVGWEMRKFRRENRHEPLPVRVFIGLEPSRRVDSPYVCERLRVRSDRSLK